MDRHNGHREIRGADFTACLCVTTTNFVDRRMRGRWWLLVPANRTSHEGTDSTRAGGTAMRLRALLAASAVALVGVIAPIATHSGDGGVAAELRHGPDLERQRARRLGRGRPAAERCGAAHGDGAGRRLRRGELDRRRARALPRRSPGRIADGVDGCCGRHRGVSRARRARPGAGAGASRRRPRHAPRPVRPDRWPRIPDGPAKTLGIEAGPAAATAMLEARDGDGRYVPFPLTVGTEPGEWRPAPPANAHRPELVDLGGRRRSRCCRRRSSARPARATSTVRPTPTSTTRSRPSAARCDSPRNPEQEAIARFFNVNPVELFNRTFRAISQAEGLSLVEDARLFAMLNVAGADAIINCWNDKRFHSFWRPITAIREGDDDGNKRTDRRHRAGLRSRRPRRTPTTRPDTTASPGRS